MRAVQFEQVEPGVGGPARGRDELVADRAISATDSARGIWFTGRYGTARRPDHRPVAGRQRFVHALPHQPGRALAAGVAELDADLGGVDLGVHEGHDARASRRAARASTGRCSPA